VNKFEGEEPLYICDNFKNCTDEMCIRTEKHKHQNSDQHHNLLNYCRRGKKYVKCIPCKEKEPKTKRVAVIWVGDVEEDLSSELASGKHVQILGHDQIFGDIIIGESELIDANRVTDKIRSKGKLNEFRIIKIRPPLPEPETVEQVLDIIKGLECSVSRPRMENLFERALEAKEREKES